MSYSHQSYTEILFAAFSNFIQIPNFRLMAIFMEYLYEGMVHIDKKNFKEHSHGDDR